MKKLSKFEKGFGALENKELTNQEMIFGGAQTSKCTEPTDGGNDYEYWVDGVHKSTVFFGPLE